MLTLFLSTLIWTTVSNAQEVNIKQGKASWYGGKHHGRKTASGEVFDKNKLTAASMKLPFGTKVKLTNIANNKTVIVKINDRGDFAKYGRAFDVSEGAARALGFVDKGIANVKYEILH